MRVVVAGWGLLEEGGLSLRANIGPAVSALWPRNLRVVGTVANIRRFHHSSCHRLWSIPARATPLENARLCKSSSISIRPEQCGSGNMATAILTRGGMDIGMSKATAVPMVMHTWDCIYLKNRNKNHIMMNTHNLPSETHHKPRPHIKICRGRDLGQGRRHFLYRQAEQG